MSKRETNGHSITILVSPTSPGSERYQARLEGDDRVLCVSRTPFFEAARKLVAEGCNPSRTLILRHTGSDVECLRATIGVAAAFTVEETGYGPKLRRWKPLPTLAVPPRIAPREGGAYPTAQG